MSRDSVTQAKQIILETPGAGGGRGVFPLSDFAYINFASENLLTLPHRHAYIYSSSTAKSARIDPIRAAAAQPDSGTFDIFTAAGR